MNSRKWFWTAIGYQCGFAYLVSLVIFQLGAFASGYGNIFGFLFAILVLALTCWLLFRKNRQSA